MTIFKLQKSPKMISRKIWVAENFLIFHTVNWKPWNLDVIFQVSADTLVVLLFGGIAFCHADHSNNVFLNQRRGKAFASNVQATILESSQFEQGSNFQFDSLTAPALPIAFATPSPPTQNFVDFGNPVESFRQPTPQSTNTLPSSSAKSAPQGGKGFWYHHFEKSKSIHTACPRSKFAQEKGLYLGTEAKMRFFVNINKQLKV